jgi:hypothetical protein
MLFQAAPESSGFWEVMPVSQELAGTNCGCGFLIHKNQIIRGKPTKEVFNAAGRHQSTPPAAAHKRALNCAVAL